ncbi:MAG: hypothetical protein MZV63_40365 [Marinilabiliales bacterium]|nr:hypothetical protein [Marinilabiliales bacterium]
MADASPAVIVHPGRHVTWYGDDTQRIQGHCHSECLAWIMGPQGRILPGLRHSPSRCHHPPFPMPDKNMEDLVPRSVQAATDVVLANGVCRCQSPILIPAVTASSKDGS